MFLPEAQVRSVNATRREAYASFLHLILTAFLCQLAPLRAGDLVMWYRQPADVSERRPSDPWSNSKGWVEALPLGNGRLGAMVYGGTGVDRLQLNEQSLWSGGRQEADRPDARDALPEIRRLLFAGRYADAQNLASQRFVCRGPGSCQGAGAKCDFGCYQTLGGIDFKFDLNGSVSDYRRELDLNTAVARTSFRAGDVRYEREAFISFADDVLVLRLSADRPQSLNFDVTLGREENAGVTSEASGVMELAGRKNGDSGVRFLARLRVVAKGGAMTRLPDGGLRVEKADEAVLFFTAATDYASDDPPGRIDGTLRQAMARSYDQLKSRHVSEYGRYFRRVSLDLGSSGVSALPMDERLRSLAEGKEDPGLVELYFQFGRYLLLSSSRPGGGLPANLQGLWAEGIQTPWNCDYHTDINVQMNYWPAEVANLSECHLPLVDFIEKLREPGRRTAAAYYGARGWVCHTVVNVWGFTSPGEHPSWGQFPMAAAWLCEHLWEHYDFTRDREFLARAYPVLREAAEFYLDFLVPEPRHGWLVTAPSTSPENNFRTADGQVAALCYGPTMDVQILGDFFLHCMEASRLLGSDADFRAALEESRRKLPPLQVGKHGQLQEWIEDFDEPEPHHRHLSHLYGLHPGRQISPRTTPEFARAARVSLERRGDDGTGWALAWKLNLWARLGEGDRAYQFLKTLLRPAKGRSVNMTNGGGTFPNLFDAHPPFQIDGNLGACAGIAEMLLQSHEGEIELLPALPRAWPAGRVKGLRARGAVGVDMEWSAGTLRRATLRTREAGTYRVRSASSVTSLTRDGVALPIQRLAEDLIAFEVAGPAVVELAAGPRQVP